MNERLFEAARAGNEEELLAALQAGANIKSKGQLAGYDGYGGFTPLLVAAHWGNKNIVRILLEKDRNSIDTCVGPESPALEGSNLLFLAAWNGDNKPGKAVIQYIAEDFYEAFNNQINAKNKHGQTPLYATGCNRCIETARFLVQHGADLSVEDNMGIGPLQFLYDSGKSIVAKTVESECQNMQQQKILQLQEQLRIQQEQIHQKDAEINQHTNQLCANQQLIDQQANQINEQTIQLLANEELLGQNNIERVHEVLDGVRRFFS